MPFHVGDRVRVIASKERLQSILANPVLYQAIGVIDHIAAFGHPDHHIHLEDCQYSSTWVYACDLVPYPTRNKDLLNHLQRGGNY